MDRILIASDKRSRDILSIALVALVAWICVRYRVPYFKDSNETFHSFMQGWNITFGHPLKEAFLTNNGLPPGTFLYTHNPNLPRYFHALLFWLGARTVETHIAVISVVCVVLTVVFVRKLFSDARLVAVILLFTGLDWVGFQYFINTYRAFSFPLFWGTILAMRDWRTAAAAFFILFQFEYAFALFVAITALSINSTRNARLGALAGATASVLLFGIQVLAVLGPERMIEEFLTTAGRRMDTSTLGTLWSSYSRYYFAALWALCGTALVASLVRPGVLSRLYVSMVLSGLALGALFTGYVIDAYFQHTLPFLTFFFVVAFAVLVETFGVLTVPFLAGLLALNSYWHWLAYPPHSTDYLEAVRKSDELVFTERSLLAVGFAANPTSVRRPDSYLYLCAIQRPVCVFTPHDGESLLLQGNEFYISRRSGAPPWEMDLTD
jgi:hypothetical protein